MNTGILQKKKEVPSKNAQYPDPCGSISIHTCPDQIWCKADTWKVAKLIPEGATVQYELTGEMTKGQYPSQILASIRQVAADGQPAALPSTGTVKEQQHDKDVGVLTRYAVDLLIADKAKSARDAVETVFAVREEVAERLNNPFE